MSVMITESDEGKSVVDEHGEEIGIVADVRGGTAYVDPDPGLVTQMKSKLGWEEADEETYPLNSSDIAEITDDEVRLRQLA